VILENAMAIAFSLFAVVLLVFGIRILIRRRATVRLMKAKGIKPTSIILKAPVPLGSGGSWEVNLLSSCIATPYFHIH